MVPLPLLAGVALVVLGGIVRMRAWHNAMGGAAPDLRYRDVVHAHLGGAGFNGIIPAHGGDAVKLALVKRRSPDASVPGLLGTLAPPAALEALLTALLLAWALATGILTAPDTDGIPLPLVGAAAAAAAGLLWLLSRRAPRVLREVKGGMSALRQPRALAGSVFPWVLLARVLRLAGLGCFIAAVGLPVTLAGALLVMAVQGGVGATGPASAPVRIAVLAASLPAAIGTHSVSFATAATLVAVTQVAPMVTNLAISLVVLGVTLRTASPRRVWGYCRSHIAAAAATVRN